MPYPQDPAPTIRMAFEDGEIREATFLDGLPRPRGGRRLSDTWMLFLDAGLDALTSAKITGSDYRAFFALARRSPVSGGEWEIRAPLVAERLGDGWDPRRVRRSVTNLIAAGLIERTRMGWIQFNPELFWRGSSRQRAEARALRVTVLDDTLDLPEGDTA